MSPDSSVDGHLIPVDGIVDSFPYVHRGTLVERVVSAAKTNHAVVVGSPPATGKTALLQQVKWYLQSLGIKVHRKRINQTADGTASLQKWLEKKGISDDEDDLEDMEETWLLFDAAQNAYAERFHSFWEFLLKGIKISDAQNKVFVVIAATYDLMTPNSPVQFSQYPHVKPYFSSDEATEAIRLFSRRLHVSDWDMFIHNLQRFARLSDGNYHIGVLTVGFRLVQQMKTDVDTKHAFSEQQATNRLRNSAFLMGLHRCFGLPIDAERNNVHHHTYEIADAVLDGKTESIPPLLLRSGILNQQGKFSSLAAAWYYNRVCFPNRADHAPGSLDDLILQAVPMMSAKRFIDTLENGFPKEATFQHLFNEALSKLLPLDNYVLPEFNTFAVDESGNPEHGELDFYINGNPQWCLELLRLGDKLGEHLQHFDESIGKYREVPMKSFLVVDCRGPKTRSVAVSESRCTLYFAQDFRSCICKMRLKDEVILHLQP